MDVRLVVQIIALAIGLTGVAMSQWRAAIMLRQAVDQLRKEVSKLNGKTEKVLTRQHALEVHCAGMHGGLDLDEDE